ncbi:MAG TPA: secretin N-terminal domain-containing protein [Planctomycetota bacterium]|nr:secretin N-terminal domain-containing protein [Planctomycetota bacterium]
MNVSLRCITAFVLTLVLVPLLGARGWAQEEAQQGPTEPDTSATPAQEPDAAPAADTPAESPEEPPADAPDAAKDAATKAPANSSTPAGGIGTPPAPANPQVPPGDSQAPPARPGQQGQGAAPSGPATAPAGPAGPAAAGAAAAGQEQPGAERGQRILPRSPDFKGERVDIQAGQIPVREFLTFLADYTGLPLILDTTNQAAVDQPITIVSPMKSVTADIVIALLQANKFLVTRQVLASGEEVLNVVAQAQAAPGPEEPRANPLIRIDGPRVEQVSDTITERVTQVRPDEIATMVFTLKYTQPADAIQSLNNLIGGAKGGAARTQAFSIVDVKNSMLVIITAKFGLLNYLAKLLSIIDVPVKEPERIIQIIEIENADAEEMAQLIQTFLQGRGQGVGGRLGGGGRPGGGAPGTPPQPAAVPGVSSRTSSSEYQTNLIADWRTQKIIVETYSERDLEDIHMLVRELDARFDIRRLKTRIYQVRYLKAEEVAADLQTLIGGAGAGLSGRAGLGTRTGGGAQGGAAGAGGRRTRTSGIPRVGRTGGAGAAGPTPSIPGAQGAGGANAPIPALIVPHIQTNSLIIQAEPEEYAEVLNILDQIDIKRRQVFLEAALVEVTTGSDLNYTIELLAGEPNDTATRTLFETSFGLSGIDFEEFNRAIPDLTAPSSVPPGALVAVMSRGKFPALVRFFKTNTDTEVLATPFILADDNQPNTIEILETRYVSNTSTGASQVTTTSQESEDAGITLDITPTISSQSAVFLELTLSVSAFQGQGTPQVLPPKTDNTVTSAVTIPDGEIFVIGGLTRENKSKAVSKVPIIGDIPLIGKLFRSESTSKSLSNLYIFLRAHILTHPEFKDGIDLTGQALNRVHAFAPELQPTNFNAPNVAFPPARPRDPDAPERIQLRQPPRSRYPEGYESPRGPYDLRESSEATQPTGYQGAAPPAPSTGTRPESRPETRPDSQPATTQPTQRSDQPPGGLDTALPPLAPPPGANEADPLRPPALEGTGYEIDPDGDSWLVPLRPRT